VRLLSRDCNLLWMTVAHTDRLSCASTSVSHELAVIAIVRPKLDSLRTTVLNALEVIFIAL